MTLLLDTHTLLWWLTGDRKLSKPARAAIQSEGCLVSAVSLWEIAIKRSLGRLDADTTEVFEEVRLSDGFTWLPVKPQHVLPVMQLPNNHKDPFNRLLVCQAMYERATLVSRDPALRLYDVKVLW